jgi:hypothetical protein
MAGYAEKTKVTTAASEAEIRQTLSRFGAVDALCGEIDGQATVVFKHNGRPYSIRVQLPDKDADEFRYTPSRGLERTKAQAYDAWEQSCRVKWRELALLIKAKLVACSNDVARFESEFLAYAMLPGGRSVGDLAELQLQAFAERGELPGILPGRCETR